MPAYSNLSDEDRIRLATVSKSGDKMLGPEERQRCAKHPRRWETFRWTWPVPGEGETNQDMIENAADAHPVRGCAACEDE